MKAILEETLDHYEDHERDLEAILDAAAASRAERA
jgi:hypothetical protein